MTTSDSVEQQIKKRLDELFIAWSPGEKEFSANDVAGFYDQSERFLAFDTLMPTTSIMQGWKAFSDNWEIAIGQLRNFNCELKEIVHMEIHGDIAWTGLHLAVSAEEVENGNPLEATQQVTLIWEQQDSKWMIIHEHLSGPVRPPNS